MKARAFLELLLQESRDIDAKLRELDIMRSRLEGFTSFLSPDRSQDGQTSHHDRIGGYTAFLVDSERLLEQRTADYSKRRALVVETMVLMDDERHSELLHARYIEGEPWREIAASLGISVTWCYTLHNRALREFEILFYN